MIAKSWRLRAQETRSEAHSELAGSCANPDQPLAPGDRRMHILESREGTETNLIPLTSWEILEAFSCPPRAMHKRPGAVQRTRCSG